MEPTASIGPTAAIWPAAAMACSAAGSDFAAENAPCYDGIEVDQQLLH